MLAWLGRSCWPPEPPGGLGQELIWRQVCLQCLARLWAPVLQTWLAGLPWLSLRRTFSALVWTSGNLGAAHPCAQSKGLSAAVCAGTTRNLQTSFAGEHLECSPCGVLACRERSHRLAGSGGAAVALAEKERGLYLQNGFGLAQAVRAGPARFRRGCWRLQVGAGETAVLGTVTGHWGLWMRPQWPGSPAP